MDHEIIPKTITICAECKYEITRPLVWAAEWYHVCGEATNDDKICNLELDHDGKHRRMEIR